MIIQNLDEGTNLPRSLPPKTRRHSSPPSPRPIKTCRPPGQKNARPPSPARSFKATRILSPCRKPRFGAPEAGRPDPSRNSGGGSVGSLLGELRRSGHPYEATVIIPGLDVQAPSTLGINIRITDRTVIIGRGDTWRKDIRFSDIQAQDYFANLSLPTAVGPIVNRRGWASVDVTIAGASFGSSRPIWSRCRQSNWRRRERPSRAR